MNERERGGEGEGRGTSCGFYQTEMGPVTQTNKDCPVDLQETNNVPIDFLLSIGHVCHI